MKKISFKQKGATLILAAFIIAIAATVFVLKSYNPAQLRLEQDKKTYLALNEAKQALVAWAVSNSVNPGQMPFPDRNTDGNYDGRSDCPSPVSAFSHSFLIGQLPLHGQTNPCVSPQTGLGIDTKDGGGNPLFYAVSRNLVHKYDAPTGNPIINPSIISSPTYPWLRMVDADGVLISDRVAAVVIASGDAIGLQNRAGVANVNNYLDTFLIGSAAVSNSNYDVNDEDFAISRKEQGANDKLVYITIDELMAALEKRVGEQARASLKKYKAMNAYYPYASQLGTSLNFVGAGGLTKGFLPVFPSCTYNLPNPANAVLNCVQPIFDVNFTSISMIEYYLPTGVFTSEVGSCTRQSGNTRCDCTGVGSCATNPTSNPTFTFSCTATSCSAIDTDTSSVNATGDFRVKGGKLTYSSGGCGITTPLSKLSNECPDSNNEMTCNTMNGVITSHDNADVDFSPSLPLWFISNHWHNYIFYQLTRPASPILTAGGRNAEAVVITTGIPINNMPFAESKILFGGAQVRPACNTNRLNDYLDSTENVDLDDTFEATSRLRSTNYNDQIFLVTP